MRTKAYGEELNAETLENVTGGGFVARPQTLPERLGWNKWWLKRRPPYRDRLAIYCDDKCYAKFQRRRCLY